MTPEHKAVLTENARLREQVADMEQRLRWIGSTQTHRLTNGRKVVFLDDIFDAVVGYSSAPQAVIR